jgi:hypothetical protein
VVSLTPGGRALVNGSSSFRKGHLAQLTATWSLQDQGNFATLLARFADAARGQPPASAEKRGTPQ